MWENHYNKLFDKPDIPCHLSNDSKIISDFDKSKRKVEYDSSCLKKQITLKELTQTTKKLKKGKATGLEISNEMLIFGFNFLKDSVLKLFNLILISRCTPSTWSLDLISPIYKSGDKMDACRQLSEHLCN